MVVSFIVLFNLVPYIYSSVHSFNRVFFRYSTMSRRFRLSSSERIDIVNWYAVYQNAAEVARQFQHRYARAPPTQESILDIARKFDETGSVHDKPRSGRPRSVITKRIKNAFLPLLKKVPERQRKELL